VDAKVKGAEMKEERHEKRVEKIEEKRREREQEGRRGLLRVFRRSSDDDPSEPPAA